MTFGLALIELLERPFGFLRLLYSAKGALEKVIGIAAQRIKLGGAQQWSKGGRWFVDVHISLPQAILGFVVVWIPSQCLPQNW